MKKDEPIGRTKLNASPIKGKILRRARPLDMLHKATEIYQGTLT